MLGRKITINTREEMIDEILLKKNAKTFESIIIGVIFRILIPIHLLEPALPRLLEENAPAIDTRCPLALKYSAKNDILAQAAFGDGIGECNINKIFNTIHSNKVQ